MAKELKKTFEAEIADTEAYLDEAAERLREVWKIFSEMKPKDVINDETVPRAQGPLRLAVRLGRVLPRRHGRRVGARPARAGRPRGRGRAARGDDQHLQGPEAGPRREAARSSTRSSSPTNRPTGWCRRGPVIPPELRPMVQLDGGLRHLRPQRPLPARDQPQQPPQAAARPGRADHRQQREAHAPGGRRRAVRQRPPWPARDPGRQPPAEVALGHAQGQAGPLPPEPAGQARGLLRALGDRLGPEPEDPPVRPAEADGARSCSSRSSWRASSSASRCRTSRPPRRWWTR